MADRAYELTQKIKENKEKREKMELNFAKAEIEMIEESKEMAKKPIREYQKLRDDAYFTCGNDKRAVIIIDYYFDHVRPWEHYAVRGGSGMNLSFERGLPNEVDDDERLKDKKNMMILAIEDSVRRNNIGRWL